MSKAKLERIVIALKELNLYDNEVFTVGELEKVAKKANVDMLDVMMAARFYRW